MKHNPFAIVQLFEEEIEHYTKAPYAIAVDSCTNALFLCCKYLNVDTVTIPNKTYLSVPQSIVHAGGKVLYENIEWSGIYPLKPYPIYDAALRLTSDMYMKGTMMCLSFHYKKHIPIGKGGMILTDDKDAADWFKKARYHGRAEKPYKEDYISEPGWNMYMTPPEAAVGLSLMQGLSLVNEDLQEENGYRDLSEFVNL
jgi:dTDP-4-amino-4,6-dideoxygalactose transaminase